MRTVYIVRTSFIGYEHYTPEIFDSLRTGITVRLEINIVI